MLHKQACGDPISSRFGCHFRFTFVISIAFSCVVSIEWLHDRCGLSRVIAVRKRTGIDPISLGHQRFDKIPTILPDAPVMSADRAVIRISRNVCRVDHS
jgi:hypothetical protein